MAVSFCSTAAQYVTTDSKIYCEIVKMCRFSSGNWFLSPNSRSFPWLVKGATQLCTSKKECNKLDLTADQYFWLVDHNAMVSFGAGEAVKDIFPLFITGDFRYVFPANSFWVKSFGCWYASCDWCRVWFLMVPFSPCGLPCLGCLRALTLVLAPCFFFLSLSLGAFFL